MYQSRLGLSFEDRDSRNHLCYVSSAYCRICGYVDIGQTYLIRSVVDDKIKDESHSASVCFIDQALHILQRAIRRIDIFVVADIITHVDLRRIKHWTDPYAIHSY
jgi:hypothetical protein